MAARQNNPLSLLSTSLPLSLSLSLSLCLALSHSSPPPLNPALPVPAVRTNPLQLGSLPTSTSGPSGPGGGDLSAPLVVLRSSGREEELPAVLTPRRELKARLKRKVVKKKTRTKTKTVKRVRKPKKRKPPTPGPTPPLPLDVPGEVVFLGTSLGFNPNGPFLGQSSRNQRSRHLTAFLDLSGAAPSWNYPRHFDWREVSGGKYLPPVQGMGLCFASWAFAAAAAVDSAWAITNDAAAPVTSRQQLIDCTEPLSTPQCAPGHPADALEYAARLWNGFDTDAGDGTIVNATARGLGLVASSQYPYVGLGGLQRCANVGPQGGGVGGSAGAGVGPVRNVYGVAGYEYVGGGFQLPAWQVLAAAVTRQPVVVMLASANMTSYRGSDGVYDEPDCLLTQNLNHAVLLVGYSFPSDGTVPFWVIQNSRSTNWGDNGFGYIAIKADPGVCGIQSLPGVYPVIGGAPPCVGINPCGAGNCTVTGGGAGYACSCPPSFSAIANTDGTETCAPSRVCAFLPSDTCGLGECVDLDNGSYDCSCPLGYGPSLRGDHSLTCGLANPEADRVVYTTFEGDTCVSVAGMYGMEGLKRLEFYNSNLDNCSSSLESGTLVSIPLVQDNCLDGCATVQNGTTCRDLCGWLQQTEEASMEACEEQTKGRYRGLVYPCDWERPDDPLTLGDWACWGNVCSDPKCSGYYKVKPGDTCSSVVGRFYGRNPSLFNTQNRGPCVDRNLFAGRPLCLPNIA